MQDSKIIDLFFERSEEAIVELSNKYGNLCMKVAMNVLNNQQDAEECVNDAYLQSPLKGQTLCGLTFAESCAILLSTDTNTITQEKERVSTMLV